jgi:hypothetical protein
MDAESVQEKTCTICCIIFPITDFVGQKKEGVITKSCIRCRNDNKKQDAKRDKVHREALARIADQKPEQKYKHYIKSAKERNIMFELSKEQLIEITSNGCYYCGMNDGKCGIDRLDSLVGYTYSNSVSCCKMCNYLKGALDVITFLRRVEHILSYHKKIEKADIRHDECFIDAKTVTYIGYKNGAKDRNKEFEINPEQFEKITSSDCYICGKKNSEDHQNGIDRKDNTIGYLFENCAACCFQCNVMKKAFPFELVLDKMLDIYKIHSEWQEKDYTHITRNINIIRKK